MKKNGDLKTRLLGGGLLLLPTLWALWKGGIFVVGLLWVCFALMMVEWGVHAWAQLVRLKNRRNLPLMGGAFLYLCLAFFAIHHSILPLWGNAIFQPNATPISLIYLIALVVCTDIGAYGIGRWMGGPLLAPKISPKKTWSGFWGGLFFGGLGGMLVILLASKPLSTFLGLQTILLSLCSQGGDLLESWGKRKLHIKDSSQWIPGHGGFWDRFDGFLAAAIGWWIINGLLPITP